MKFGVMDSSERRILNGRDNKRPDVAKTSYETRNESAVTITRLTLLYKNLMERGE